MDDNNFLEEFAQTTRKPVLKIPLKKYFLCGEESRGMTSDNARKMFADWAKSEIVKRAMNNRLDDLENLSSQIAISAYQKTFEQYIIWYFITTEQEQLDFYRSLYSEILLKDKKNK